MLVFVEFPGSPSCSLYKLLQGLINIAHWVICCGRRNANKFVSFCRWALVLLVPIVWTLGLTLSSGKKYHYCPHSPLLPFNFKIWLVIFLISLVHRTPPKLEVVAGCCVATPVWLSPYTSLVFILFQTLNFIAS